MRWRSGSRSSAPARRSTGRRRTAPAGPGADAGDGRAGRRRARARRGRRRLRGLYPARLRGPRRRRARRTRDGAGLHRDGLARRALRGRRDGRGAHPDRRGRDDADPALRVRERRRHADVGAVGRGGPPRRLRVPVAGGRKGPITPGLASRRSRQLLSPTPLGSKCRRWLGAPPCDCRRIRRKLVSRRRRSTRTATHLGLFERPAAFSHSQRRCRRSGPPRRRRAASPPLMMSVTNDKVRTISKTKSHGTVRASCSRSRPSGPAGDRARSLPAR